MKRFSILAFVVAFAMLAGVTAAEAGYVNPTSYDMIGGSRSDVYDDTYPQTSDGQNLTGGLGDLTDGTVALLNWNQYGGLGHPSPYVGWQQTHVASPVITFHFDNFPVNVTNFDIHIHAGYRPGSVDIWDGVQSYNFSVTQPGSPAGWINFGPVNLTGNLLTLRLNDGPSDWIMISEVRFEGTAVPLPGALWLLGSGLLGLVGWSGFRKS